ncbi:MULTISPECIES: TIGR04104 family putative zinc finger protein [unclassified Sedimentibacter]|uniref:TIGR04104 family putative zinc finger protein n=1 Tax=unclassified Sedimentibacter TaxID=2649220 RepID=UPI0027DF4685|nr:TIGR04104 family putative zinc finger protein [Sedimentibacter sp. MB35-C1]WMJ77581.1 hypothetical protein RBQ61_01235 [Sedimentibacter sp. MB35-C1]
MYKCSLCSDRFKYKDVLKSIWVKGYAPIICTVCGTKHYPKISTRIVISLAMFLPLIVINSLNLFFDGYVKLPNLFIIYYIIWTALLILITPFIAGYYTKSADKSDETKSLLISNLTVAQADVIISMLESYDVPYFKEVEKSESLEVFPLNSNINIYIPPKMLKTAKELIDVNNIIH